MQKDSTAYLEELGGRIRELRGKRTQLEFARAFGIASQTTVSAIERGGTAPGADLLARLVEESRCDARWLMTGEGEASAVAVAPARPEAVILERQPAAVLIRNVREVMENGELWKSAVPVAGSFAPDMGVLRSSQTPEEGTAPFVTAGPFPEGSIALRTAAPIFGVAAGACLIVGPPVAIGEMGFGLVAAKKIGDALCAWARRGKKVHLYANGEERVVTVDDIIEVRVFLALV
jgi:transcriptional regulator with XRE-family HTH domain